jgi:phage/plasmid primase-like uncharacterized protein
MKVFALMNLLTLYFIIYGDKMYKQKISGAFWDTILTSLGGISEDAVVKNKQQPCPICGGTDRYQYLGVNKHTGIYDGSYLCRGCGAGDGFTFLSKLLSEDFKVLKPKVMKLLGIEEEPSNYIDFNTLTFSKVMNNLTKKDLFDHPYLKHKQLTREHFNDAKIALYKDRIAIGGHILIDNQSLFDELDVESLELISADGFKLAIKGKTRKNSFFRVGIKETNRLYLTEGMASAVSLHAMTGCSCFSTFGTTNFVNVFKVIKKHLLKTGSNAQLVLSLDNDPPGLNVASTIKDIIKNSNLNYISCIIPTERNTDFSDLYIKNNGANIVDVLDQISVLYTC